MMAREHNASSLEVAPDDDLRVTEVASDLLSVNNGATITTVADLTDEQVAMVLGSGALEQEIADQCVGETDRAWLADYCARHSLACERYLVVG